MTKFNILFCCEYGPLEKLTIMMVKSLLKYGDLPKETELYAFAPRKGFKPTKATIKQLEDLKVNYIDLNLNQDYRYYPLYNKPAICEYAEKHFKSDNLFFLDSDIFIMNPVATDLEIFKHDIAMQREFGWMVCAGKETDPYYAYWQEVFKILEVDRPRETTSLTHGGRKMIGYWNSGAFVSRNSTGLMSRWKENTDKLLTAKHWRGLEYWFMEQVALSATIQQMDLDLYEFQAGYNYPTSMHEDVNTPDQIQSVDELVIAHHLKEYEKSFSTFDNLSANNEKVAWIREQLADLKVFPAPKTDWWLNQRNTNLQKLIYFKQKFGL